MPGVSPERPIAAETNSNRRRKTVRILMAILLPGTVFAWIVWYTSDQTSDDLRQGKDDSGLAPTAREDQFRLPSIATSRFRNASKAVAYVGNRKCQECHSDEHDSYLKTMHSRSLAEVDISREPPNGEFFHEISGRHYRVYREGKQLRLREFIQDSEGQEVVLVDHAAHFSFGSGNYARMYLVKVDDYLIEAPMTWYPRRQSWGMSAGYEKDSNQAGFDREVGWGCIHCHGGRVETIDGADQRLNVTEMAISCERCHGPGALHVKERKAELPIRGSIDDSIVNIRHLSRERQEDVCSQCHLSASADIEWSWHRPPRARSQRGRLSTGFANVRLRHQLSDQSPGFCDDGGRPDRTDEIEPLLPRIEINDVRHMPQSALCSRGIGEGCVLPK